MTLVYLGISFVAGLLLGSRLLLPAIVFPVMALPVLLAFFFRHRSSVVIGSLCLVALLGGILRFNSFAGSSYHLSLQPYQGREVELRGVVSAEPEPRDRNTLLTLTTREVNSGQGWEKAPGPVLIWLSRFPERHYGDLLEVRGKLENPAVPGISPGDRPWQPGGSSFMRYPEVKLVKEGQGSPLQESLAKLRGRISGVLSAALPQPQAALAEALLVGTRSEIPPSLQDSFSRTGTAHLLAISGLNISIVLGVFLSLVVWLFGRQRPFYLCLAFVLMWLYVLLSGMHAPSVRAGVMGSVFLLGEGLGRQRSSLTALVFAAAIMAGLSPGVLWEASFQLSFLAMVGLIIVAPPLQRLARRAPSPLHIPADGLAVTSGAFATTWPLVSYYFGIVSLVALPANLLVMPFLLAVMLTTALAGFLGLVALPLAQGMGWLAWLFLTYVMKVVEAFAALPFSHIGLALDGKGVWVYYLAVGAVTGGISYRRRIAVVLAWLAGCWNRFKTRIGIRALPLPPLRWLAMSLLAMAALVWMVALSSPEPRLRVAFIDVAEGDAILIQSPARHQVLIDGGASLNGGELELGQRLPFWDRTLDLVVLTHPHADHVAGLIPVLQGYGVGRVVEPDLQGLKEVGNSAIYGEFKLIRENIAHLYVAAGWQIDLGDGVVLEVLHPPPQLIRGTASDVDNNSLVLRLAYKKISFLFAADIQQEAEHELVSERADLRSTVLKVAHHGSDTSTSPQFLAAVDPQVAVISVGAEDRFGHPSPEVVGRLKEKLGQDRVYLTSQRVTIEVITDGEKLWVRTEK